MMRLGDTIGATPLIELGRMSPSPRVRLLAKLEGGNPGSSVKDRAALRMIVGAERRGALCPGVRLIEPTSGNTGIALAMIAASRGYALELVMPEDATAERVRTMRALGATVTLTPAEASMEGAIDYARRAVAAGGVVMLDQFANDDNWRAHYEGTGPELWRDVGGELTHFVSAMGTTGTIMGVSRFLKERAAGVQIVGVQPQEGAKIPGIRRWPAAYLPTIFEPARVDRVLEVSAEEAAHTARALARLEGVFCGMSSGGAAAAALRLAAEIDVGVIACVICDRGDRYLSSSLFEEA